jgi:protein ImuB
MRMEEAMRIACLRIPDFPLQALRRAEPDLAEVPVVVALGRSPHDLVVAVAPEAAEQGVRPGMTAAQARQVAAEVLVRVTPPEVAEAAEEALADVATGVSPRIKRARPGEVLLDVAGLELRIGGEIDIARALLRACHHVGLDAVVGIASSSGVARVAARAPRPHPSGVGGRGSGVRAPSRPATPDLCSPREGDGWRGGGPDPRSQTPDPSITIVAAGEEREFLAPLPLALLDPAPGLAARLVCWGVHRAGELARLPRDEIALRMKTEGVELHRLACGEPEEAFIPDPLREVLKEGVWLEDPIVALETFLFVARGILVRLERRLELRGEGFAEILLELALEGGERREYRVRPVTAVREVPAVLALVRLQLEASLPGAPVEGVSALVTPGRVRLTQGSLFGPRLPAPGRLAVTLARLAALVGPNRAGAPALLDTHRPGTFSVLPFRAGDAESQEKGTRRRGGRGREGVGTSHAGAEERSGASAPPAPPVLRSLRPPREALVVTAQGRPVSVRVGGLGGGVVDLAGPYRVVGEWWGDEPFARDEFDVATTDGALLRVFFDRLEHRWYADGYYD